MAQIGRHELGINMVDTAQVNWIGADAKATVTNMKKIKENTQTQHVATQ